MSATIITPWVSESSPRAIARLAGVFFLLTMAGGIFAQALVADRLVVPGDAAVTAANVMTHNSLYLFGFTVYLIEMACQIAMTSLFYDLLKSVNRSVSLLAAFLSLAGCTIKTASRLFYFTPSLLLGGAGYLSVFNREQLQALALLFFKVNDYGAGIGLVFFGFSSLLKGYLIIRSTFLPRILGVFSIFAGAGLLAFLSPPLGHRLFPYIALVGLVGSVAQIFWLLVFGVDEQRWQEQAGLATAST